MTDIPLTKSFALSLCVSVVVQGYSDFRLRISFEFRILNFGVQERWRRPPDRRYGVGPVAKE